MTPFDSFLAATDAYNDTKSLVGFTTSFDPASNKTYERHLHAENRSHLYPDYDSADRLLEFQRGTLASGGATLTTAITLPGTNTLQNSTSTAWATGRRPSSPPSAGA